MKEDLHHWELEGIIIWDEIKVSIYVLYTVETLELSLTDNDTDNAYMVICLPKGWFTI